MAHKCTPRPDMPTTKSKQAKTGKCAVPNTGKGGLRKVVISINELTEDSSSGRRRGGPEPIASNGPTFPEACLFFGLLLSPHDLARHEPDEALHQLLGHASDLEAQLPGWGQDQG